MLTGKVASDGDLAPIQVPEHLKPGFRRYNFVFLPKKHRLFFETRTSEGRTIGPTVAQRVFEKLLNQKPLMERFGMAEVIPEPQREALARILKMHRLDWLELFITRPNPDDAGGETEREVLKRLQEQNAKSHTEQYHAVNGETLKPDARTQSLARVANSNGYVSGRGRDSDNKVIRESTQNHPLRYPVKYNENQQSGIAVLIDTARDLARRLTGQ